MVFRRGIRIGVDVGAVRVGVAQSDPDGLLATPVETLARDEEQHADLDAIAAFVAERSAIEVVVGLPRSMDGQERAAAGLARTYAEEIARKVAPVPVRLVDERLSSAGAHQLLHQAGRSRRRHKAVVDQAAAVLILQSALDVERNTGKPAGLAVGAS